MPSNVLIGNWATGVWSDLGSPSFISALTISGYAVQPSTIGSLNNRIQSCYSGTGYMGTGQVFDVYPPYTDGELALIGAMYEVSFYNQLAFSSMGAGGNNLPWTNIREGDSSISRVNAANLGKEYREMANNAKTRLDYLVNAYINNYQRASTPRDVSYLNPPTYNSNPYGDGGPGVYGYIDGGV